MSKSPSLYIAGVLTSNCILYICRPGDTSQTLMYTHTCVNIHTCIHIKVHVLTHVHADTSFSTHFHIMYNHLTNMHKLTQSQVHIISHYLTHSMRETHILAHIQMPRTSSNILPFKHRNMHEYSHVTSNINTRSHTLTFAFIHIH